MTPQMAQPAHSAGLMLAQMSRQNGAPQPLAPSSTGSPLHAGPAGGWPAAVAGVRPQFNNQVIILSHLIYKLYFLHHNAFLFLFQVIITCLQSIPTIY